MATGRSTSPLPLRPPGRLAPALLRQIGMHRRSDRPKPAETLGGFTPRYEISLRGVKPEPEGLSSGWLWITPAARRAAPVCERIIESPARRTPDPVSRDAGPRTASPPASRTARPPTRRNRSAVPLTRGGGCSSPVTVPTVGHWIVARTQRPGLDPYRGG